MAEESPQYVALCNGLAHLQRALAVLEQATEELSGAGEPVFAGEVRSFITPMSALATRLYERGLDRAAAEVDEEDAEDVEMVPVDSSNIAAVGYRAKNHVLRVRFKNGGTYDYASVDPSVHAAFMSAESKGGYFTAFIRRVYTATKVAPDEAKEGEVLPAGSYEAGVEQAVRESVARGIRNQERAALGLPPE